jgi:hypothetical protein
MRLVLVTAPTVEPLTAAEARARLNIGSEVTDEVLDGLIKAARQMIDGGQGWLGRALITQTWRLMLDHFPGYGCCPGLGFGHGHCHEDNWDGGAQIRIPLPPLQSIASVSYVDRDGVTQTIPANDYVKLSGEPAAIVPAYGKSWPVTRYQPDAVTVEFVCGYGAAGSNVDEPIRSAIALQVNQLRSLTARNLFVSSETEDGIGSTTYVVGGNAGAAVDQAVQCLLSTYRVYS